MGRFLIGFVLGGVLVYVSLHYHVVRARDGVHLVAKATSTFSQTYVDIRTFGVSDWADNAELAIAIQNAGKGDLLREQAVEAIGNAVQDVFDSSFGNR